MALYLTDLSADATNKATNGALARLLLIINLATCSLEPPKLSTSNGGLIDLADIAIAQLLSVPTLGLIYNVL
jgi:hypothetical protein